MDIRGRAAGRADDGLDGAGCTVDGPDGAGRTVGQPSGAACAVDRLSGATASGERRAGCSLRSARAPRHGAGFPRARAGGITLVELLAGLTVAAVLATLAVPTFAGLRRSAGLGTATSELLGALHFARSAAVLNGLPVTLCLSADESTCVGSSSALARGWLVFAQPGAKVSAAPLVAQPVLRSFRLPPELTVHGSRAAVTFWPVARSASTSTFELCDAESKTQGRAVVLSQTGRPRVAVEEPSCGP